MNELPEGLRGWAALPGPALLVDALGRRIHRGGSLESGSLTLRLTTAQRREVGRLLGVDWEISGRAVTVRALGAALAPHGLTVARFVELLYGGPLPVGREVAAARQHAEQLERVRVLDILGAAGVDAAIAEIWLAGPRTPKPGTGRTVELATAIARVWPSLPRAGQAKRLGQLAAETTGDAHALDHNTELGRAVARLIAIGNGDPPPSRPGRHWRAVWASAGVRCDTVSSRVLTLNVALDITGGHRPGAPAWLTLRDLLGPWCFAPVPPVLFVCENPTVVEAAADELGARCPPLVCTDGMPALAALDLLAGAAEAGVSVRVRADIDPAGLAIVRTVLSTVGGGELWRFDAATYCRHFGLEVSGAAQVADVYAVHGRDLHEEAILSLLLADLRAAQGGKSTS
ncbi:MULTISPECIES: DUF2399 domain-containing protein [Nocardia]|uniref:DUF2399 domain-containing protein n=1 Tax=Nocardia TaxID=1817 RepID=UPI000D6935DA|nr:MULTISPECIES: TIGR02679 domain-containing protein [Nocardia]